MDRMTDITDRFLLLEDHLIYMDEPLEGVARSRDSGDLFVIRSLAIISELLWHWVLIPVDSTDVDIEQIFLSATADPPMRRMSLWTIGAMDTPNLVQYGLSTRRCQWLVPLLANTSVETAASLEGS